MDCLSCRFNAALHNDYQPCATNRDAAGLGVCEDYNGFMPLEVGCHNCANGPLEDAGPGEACCGAGTNVCMIYDGSTPTHWQPKDTPVSIPVACVPEPEPERQQYVEDHPVCPRDVSHYNFRGGIEPATFIASNDLSYLEGNIVKYIYRYPVKQGSVALKKARDYLDMLIQRQEQKESAAEVSPEFR